MNAPEPDQVGDHRDPRADRRPRAEPRADRRAPRPARGARVHERPGEHDRPAAVLRLVHRVLRPARVPGHVAQDDVDLAPSRRWRRRSSAASATTCSRSPSGRPRQAGAAERRARSDRRAASSGSRPASPSSRRSTTRSRPPRRRSRHRPDAEPRRRDPGVPRRRSELVRRLVRLAPVGPHASGDRPDRAVRDAGRGRAPGHRVPISSSSSGGLQAYVYGSGGYSFYAHLSGYSGAGASAPGR